MAKKSLKKKASKSRSGVSQIADPVLNSARDIWRAGLGAFALAQQEGSKVLGQGTALFDNLVKEGAKVEAEGKKAVDDSASTATRKAKSRRDDIEGKLEAARKQAEGGWDRLENVFEDRVARVMDRLGIPTSDDITKLNRQVETLSEQVARLAKRESAARATAKAPANAPTSSSKAKKPGKATAVTVYHLLPKDEQWAVRREGEDRNLRVLDRKREALDAARAIAQGHEPSRLVVHRADGTIQDSFSYGDEH